MSYARSRKKKELVDLIPRLQKSLVFCEDLQNIFLGANFLTAVDDIITIRKYCRFSIRDIAKSSRTEVFCKKAVLRNITKFTGKHLY